MYCGLWIHWLGDVVPSCEKDVERSLASKLCWIESSPSEKLCVPLEFETRIATATLGTGFDSKWTRRHEALVAETRVTVKAPVFHHIPPPMPAASLVLFAALGLSEGSSSLRPSVASTAFLLLQGIRLGHVAQTSEAGLWWALKRADDGASKR